MDSFSVCMLTIDLYCRTMHRVTVKGMRLRESEKLVAPDIADRILCLRRAQLVGKMAWT